MRILNTLRNLASGIHNRKLVETAVEKTTQKVEKTTRKLVKFAEDVFEGKKSSKADKKKDQATSGRTVHGPLKSVPHSEFKLKEDFSDTKRVEKIVASGGYEKVSLSDMPLDRTWVPGGDKGAGNVPSTGMTKQKPISFAFDKEDQNTTDWYPQAVTTSADADGTTGKVDGKSWVAVSWYNKNEPRSRITFVDHSNPDAPNQQKYRHVELMVPNEKTGKLEPLKSHVGGVTWSGDYLYVAQTNGGIRVFDVRELLKVTDSSKVPSGTEEYVLPQVGYYKTQGLPGTKPTFSGLSLDRTGTNPALLSQEYDGENPGGRIIRWEIDPKTGRLAAEDGVVQADDAWSVPMTRVAGVVKLEDGFRIATMGTPANLFEAREGAYPEQVDSLAKGIQQFSWDWTRNKVWTLAEHPGNRVVWAFEP